MVAMSRGGLITNKGRTIIIEKNGLKVKFNDKIETKNGFICGIVLTVKSDDYSLATVAAANRHRPQDIKKLHKKLGHAPHTLVQKPANFMMASQK